MPTEPPPAPAATGTGVGSLPGTDVRAATRAVFDLLPELPHLPELPARGPGATMTGRLVALLGAAGHLHADLQPAGWRLVGRQGVDERRAVDLLDRDLDALEEVADGYAGPVKVALPGPLTAAAMLELTRGERVVSDHGAVRDLAEALADVVTGWVTDLRRRVPHSQLLVQVDEPSLPAVLAGEVPTASGFSRLRAVDEPTAVERLAVVLAAADAAGAWPLVHCCAASPPFGLLHKAGARGVSFDLAMVGERDDEAVGEAVESGLTMFVGAVPSLDPTPVPSTRDLLGVLRGRWARLGFGAGRLAELVVTPSCGLAGASPDWARTAMRRSRDVARALAEAAEEEHE